MHRYVHEALAVLAAMAPTLQQALITAAAKAYVVLDGTLVRIDRVAMASRGDRVYYSGKHKAHGLNVQTLADPAGCLIWASPPLPGSRHDIGAAREHGLLKALASIGVQVLVDRGYQGAGRECPGVRVPQRSRRKDRATNKLRPLSENQRAVNRSHAALRAPGERANAQLRTGGSCARSASARHGRACSWPRCRPSSSLADPGWKRLSGSRTDAVSDEALLTKAQ